MPPHAAPRRPQPPRRRPRRPGRSAAKAAPKDKGGDKAKAGDKADDKDVSNVTSKIRSLLVGASVVVIVLGTFKMAMTLLDTGSVLQLPAMEHPASRPHRRSPPRRRRAAPGPRRRAGALDDLADAGREAVEQFFRTKHAG